MPRMNSNGSPSDFNENQIMLLISSCTTWDGSETLMQGISNLCAGYLDVGILHNPEQRHLDSLETLHKLPRYFMHGLMFLPYDTMKRAEEESP